MASFATEFKHLEIQLEDIKSATNNFDESKVIGRGGFGKVYAGELSHSQSGEKSLVAIKRLDRRYGQGDPEFFKEIRMLSCYRHENLIALLGFCIQGDEMILIYEHASGGSLDRLLSSADLTWKQRLRICLDAAKGLSFLHDPNGTQQRVLHRDIKSANILLDKNMAAKVSDFGLSKMGSANPQYSLLITGVVGTPGYCDPLYMETYQLTKESDVYSFGVVLFEVLCGRQCGEYSNGQLKILVPFWKQGYVDKKLEGIVLEDIKQKMNQGSLEIFAGIAYQCLQISREQRPTMSLVVEKLEAALQTQMLSKEEQLEQESSVPLTEGFKLDNEDGGKICCMLGAKDLSITWLGDTRYWEWGHMPESRFAEVAILKMVWWLDICGSIPSMMLSPKSTYVAYLVFKITRNSSGLDVPAKTTVSFGGISNETSNVYLKQPRSWAHSEAPTHVSATTRNDGWMEIKLGEFYHDHGDEGEVLMRFQGHDTMIIKQGLIVEGIELRLK